MNLHTRSRISWFWRKKRSFIYHRLGTPTGNPIVTVVKIASNTILFNRMSNFMDVNKGTIIDCEETI